MSELIVNHAPRLNELHHSIFGLAKKSVAEATEAGRLLIEQKAAVKAGGGQWLQWFKENVEFGHDTASRYMRLHERRDEISRSAKSVTEAYRLLAGDAETILKADEVDPESVEQSVPDGSAEQESETSSGDAQPESAETVMQLKPRSGRHRASRVITFSPAVTLKHLGTQYVNKACDEIDKTTDEEERQRLIAVLLEDFDRLRGEVQDHFFPKLETSRLGE